MTLFVCDEPHTRRASLEHPRGDRPADSRRQEGIHHRRIGVVGGCAVLVTNSNSIRKARRSNGLLRELDQTCPTFEANRPTTGLFDRCDEDAPISGSNIEQHVVLVNLGDGDEFRYQRGWGAE